MNRHAWLSVSVVVLAMLLGGAAAARAMSPKPGFGFRTPWDVWEDFSDGNAAGDPDWVEVAGDWTVPDGRKLVSSPSGINIALSDKQDLKSFGTGVIRVRTRLPLSGELKPNSAILFSYLDQTHYRYAMLKGGPLYGTLIIGQVGAFGGETGGVKARRRIRLRKGRYVDLDLHLYDSGKVRLKSSSARRRGVQYLFSAPVGGGVALKTRGSASSFRDFRAFTTLPGTPPGDLQASGLASSLRLMTYNVAMLATGNTNEDVYEMDDEDRAAKIADGIRRADADVVALNEVFAEDGRGEFVSQLSRGYPHYVRKLDKLDADEDSGLMLFSRHPFIPLTNQVNLANDVQAISNGFWDQVAFVEYDDFSFPDGYANKGCALVRLQNSFDGQKFTVVFTHTQASYGDDDLMTATERQLNRRNQMKTCSTMMQETLTAEELTDQQLFMMGDLNIDGNPHSLDADLVVGSGTEWHRFFDVAHYADGHFYACGNVPDDQCPGPVHLGSTANLTDTWAYETLPTDLGRTTGASLVFNDDNPDSGERLDYILRNRPDSAGSAAVRWEICDQHRTVAWEVGEQDGRQQYSDHLPTLIDMNRRAPHCSPLNPLLVSFSPTNPDVDYNGHITFEGSMQWLAITQEGTYSFIVNEPNVAFDVYTSTDLSRPYKSFHEETSREGLKYEFTDPPYWIRLYAVDPATGRADRTWKGPFLFRMHQHQCRTAMDACGIYAGETKTYTWPTGQPLAPNDTIWYSFYTDVGEKGDFPLLKYYLGRASTAVGFTLSVAENASLYPDIPFDNGPSWQDSLNLYAESKSLGGSATGGGKKYLIKIHREAPTAGIQTTIRYTTNLTYFIPIRLHCVVQNDTFGDDEIWTFLDPDSPYGGTTTSLDSPPYAWFASFDEDTVYGAEQLGIRRYVNWMVMNMVEEDEGLNFDNDYHTAQPNAYSRPDFPGQLQPLDENSDPVNGTFVWADAASDEDADYWYNLDFQLMHEMR